MLYFRQRFVEMSIILKFCLDVFMNFVLSNQKEKFNDIIKYNQYSAITHSKIVCKSYRYFGDQGIAKLFGKRTDRWNIY